MGKSKGKVQQRRTGNITQAQRDDLIDEHLPYEIDHFRLACELLGESQAKRPQHEWILIIEAYWLQVRNLFEIFWNSPVSARNVCHRAGLRRVQMGSARPPGD